MGSGSSSCPNLARSTGKLVYRWRAGSGCRIYVSARRLLRLLCSGRCVRRGTTFLEFGRVKTAFF